MKYSLDDYLVLALPALADGLAAPRSFAAMRAMARRLPPSADFGFECRLADDDAAVDLLARVRPDDGTRSAYAGLNAAVALPAELREHVVWKRLGELCASWAAPADPLHRDIVDLWVELDQAEHEAQKPVPCIFFQPVREPARVESITSAALARTFGSTGALAAAIQRCFAAARDGVQIIQVGVMLSRPDAPMRLVLQVGHACARSLLAELGWPGPQASLDHFLSEIRPLISSFSIDLDVREGVSPKIGFECYGDAAPDPRALMATLLDRLCTLGLSSRAKADALLGWPGIVEPATSAAPWPRNLAAAALRRGWRSSFQRRVNHLKIVYAPGQPPCVKAYFGLTHRWLEAGTA